MTEEIKSVPREPLYPIPNLTGRVREMIKENRAEWEWAERLRTLLKCLVEEDAGPVSIRLRIAEELKEFAAAKVTERELQK